MGYNFISRDADQTLLLPRDVREWLPAGHLCWRVLGAVEELDLSAFTAAYRFDGQGRAAYHPAMMTCTCRISRPRCSQP